MEALHKVFLIQNTIKNQTKLVAYLLELCYMETLHKVFFIQNAIKNQTKLVAYLLELCYMDFWLSLLDFEFSNANYAIQDISI